MGDANEKDELIIKLQNQLSIARNEIKNLRQQVVNLKYTHQKDVEDILSVLKGIKCENCRKKPEGEKCSCEFPNLQSIGTIESWFSEKRGIPRQGALCTESKGVLNLHSSVLNNPNYALSGLEEFSHLWIIYFFHKTDSNHVRTKVAPPKLNGERVGVFSTRSPHRPCPIGLSVVKVEKICGEFWLISIPWWLNSNMMVGVLNLLSHMSIDSFCVEYEISVIRSLVQKPVNSQKLVEKMCQKLSRLYLVYQKVSVPVIWFFRLQGQNETVKVFWKKNKIYFSGVDMLNGTPVLDIKPYIPHYDNPTLITHSSEREVEGGLSDEESPQTMREIVEKSECRSAPDGEEDSIRIPNWIANSASAKLKVEFTKRGLAQLNELSESDVLKSAIINIVEEDPRSVYLKQKLGSQFYTFLIKDVHVTCKFDDANGVVVIYQIQKANENCECGIPEWQCSCHGK